MTTISGYKRGKIRVVFPDNEQEIVAHTFPEFEMKGLMKGDRTFDYLKGLKVSDYENNVHADIVVNPDKKGWFRRMFSSSQKTAYDHVDGVISDSEDFEFKDYRGTELTKIEKDNDIQIYHKLQGNWTTSYKVDDEEVWNKNYRHLTVQYVNNPLPSD